MTNEKAIEAIERFRLLAHGHAVLAEALDMAIEALNFVSEYHQSNIEAYARDMGVSLEQAERELRVEGLSCSEKPNRSDTIYRQDAIDALEEQLDYLQMLNKNENPTAESKWYGVNWARNTIAELPSAQPEQKWIPCSERFPEKNGRYLVTNSAWGAMEVDWNAWMDGAWLYPNTKPIAWMPLPEPYKGDTND